MHATLQATRLRRIVFNLLSYKMEVLQKSLLKHMCALLDNTEMEI